MRATAANPWGLVRRLPSVVGDVALVVVFGVIAVLEHGSSDHYQAGPLWLNVVLTGAVVLGLGFRRVAPVAVLLVTCGVLLVPTAFVHHDFLVWSHLLPLMIEVYTVARRRRLPVALAGAGVALATVVLDIVLDVGEDSVALGFLVLLPALGGGVVMRRDAERREAIAEALAELRGESATRERLALLDERARVARELHDVVAHAVSVMVTSAQRASTELERDPDAAERAVLTLESSGRAATSELRRMLGLLRSPTGEVEPGEPAPGLGTLDTLVARMRESGLRVTVVEDGDRPVLPPGFEVAVYRVVQEALTNVLVHAGPTDVALRLSHPGPEGGDLLVEVVDRGPADGHPTSRSARPGHGLVGMRERVALLGGDLRTGPEDAGYAVRVRLPLPRPARQPAAVH